MKDFDKTINVTYPLSDGWAYLLSFFVGKDGLWLLQLAEKPEAAATQLEKYRGGKNNA